LFFYKVPSTIWTLDFEAAPAFFDTDSMKIKKIQGLDHVGQVPVLTDGAGSILLTWSAYSCMEKNSCTPALKPFAYPSTSPLSKLFCYPVDIQQS